MGVKADIFPKNIWLLLVVVGIVVLFQYLTKEGGVLNTKSQAENYVNALLTDEELVYTKHANCRMDCRTISKAEVEDILYNGKVNWEKTRKNDQPCPSYALEGNTADGQRVRIVFADCNNATKVVTAIDLENEYDCYCP